MWLLIGVSVFLIVITHWFLTSPYGYWKKRRIPHPPPSMLVGNLGASLIMKKNLGQIYRDIYYQYKDLLYVGFYKFRTPGLVIRDMDLIKDILIKEFASFHDNDLHFDEKLDPYFSRNPFVIPGPKWKTVRSLITSGITSGKVKNMLCLMTDACKNMVKYLENEPDACGKSGLEVKELAGKYTTDVVASCAFGLDAHSFSDSNSQFREMGRKWLTPSFWLGIQHLLLFTLPNLAKILHVKFIPTEVSDWFARIVNETVKYREKNKITRPDYLDLLIQLKTKNSKEYEFKDIDVVAQAMTFYGDGFETSSITLGHTLYELGENPDIQTRLREEIDTVLAKYNGEITYEAMQEMTYLDNVLTEGLRKHSPILFMARLCTKRFELPPPKGQGTGPNLIVEPGTPIIIPVLAIHTDPTYYPNPEKFDPDRFTEENKKTRPKCAFLAFGEGPRICLGSRFGLAQVKAALIALISNFEVKVNPKTAKQYEMDPTYFMNSSKGGLWLNFVKREKS